MKRGFINPTVRKKAGLRGNAFIFLVCFCIASFIWGLIKLSKDYSEVFLYQVTYKGLPSDKQIINYPDSVFKLSIKQKGFKVLMQKISSKRKKIEIDLSSKLHAYPHSKNAFFVLSAELISQINNQLPPDAAVVSVSPDTIRFYLDKMVSKKVPVIPDIKLNFEKQYSQSGKIKVVPDSVLVKGPVKAIDSIKVVRTDFKQINKIDKSQIVSLTFNNLGKDFKIFTEPDYVKTFIPVDKYTETTIEVPVIINNPPTRFKIKTLPEKVKITYLVSLSDYKKVKPDMFTAVVDYKIAREFLMKVDIIDKPDFIKINKIVPEKVEFILF